MSCLETSYIIYSYIDLEELLKILNYPTIDKVVKRYSKLPEIDEICKEGNLEILKYLVYRGSVPDQCNMEMAIQSKNTEMVLYLHKLGTIFSGKSVAFLCENFELLKKLIHAKIKLPEPILDCAYSVCSIEVLSFLYQNGYKGAPNFISYIGSSYSPSWEPKIKYLLDNNIVAHSQLMDTVHLANDTDAYIKFLESIQ